MLRRIKDYYPTNNEAEIKWLESRGGLKPRCMDGEQKFYLFEKSAALFILLANFYNQLSLQCEFDEMDTAFNYSSDPAKVIDPALLPNNPLLLASSDSGGGECSGE